MKLSQGKQKKEEKEKYTINFNIYLFSITIIFTAILLVLIGFILEASVFNQELKNPVCYDMQSFNKTLSDIQDKCGSTYLVKRYGNDEEWWVFNTQGCGIGDYNCFYKKLEDCLK